ncbi:PilN domain-containing protein [Nitrospira sp. Kam-Ns4a]
MLPRLSLQFASPDWRALRTGQWGLWLVLLGSLTFSAWAWTDSISHHDEADRYEQAARRTQTETRQFIAKAKQAGFNLSDERTKTLPREVAFANQLLEKRAFSWTRFLSDLESTVPPRVSITSVAINFTGLTITLTGAALTLKDLTSFVDGLEAHEAFEKAVLSHHRTTELFPRNARGGPGREQAGIPIVEFTLTVAYRPRP